MFTHYLKLAIRNLSRFGVYTSINLIGLSIGIAVSLTILLYVSHQLQYDRFHKNGPGIVKVNAQANWGGQTINMSSMSSAFGPIIKENNGHIVNYVRVRTQGKCIIESDAEHRFYENQFVFADSSFFNVFTFPLLSGSRAALGRPNTVILTEAAANKYFGTHDPLGKTLVLDKKVSFEIVGIARDFPSNSSLKYDFIASYTTLATLPETKEDYNRAVASVGSVATYFLMDNPTAIADIEKTMAEQAKTSIDEKYELGPLSVQSNFAGEDTANRYLGLFVSIACIILTLALINYMSLTTARAGIRAKEVGVRKVTGAKRGSLAAQFYMESAVMTIAAFALAILFLQLFLPPVMNLLQVKIDSGFIWKSTFIGIVLMLFIACILLSGSYPALILSRFMPALVLKGQSGSGRSGQWVRKGFTVFQFAASIALIVCSLVVQHQLDFLQTKEIGLNKEQVMVLSLDPAATGNHHALLNDLRSQAGIVNVAAASHTLYKGGTAGVFTETPKTKEQLFLNLIEVDENFFKTLDIAWLRRANDSTRATDYVLNETALTDLKLTPDDLNEPLKLAGRESRIAGVVKDFNYTSLRGAVKPLMFTVRQDTSRSITEQGGAIYVRLDPATQFKEKVATVESIFRKHQPQAPFEYYFLDDAFNNLYSSEDRLARIFTAFTGIALLVACMGLFGLVTFAAEVRTKEIGIRKVLGASLNSIITLLSKDFLLLVIISAALASPLAYWVMHDWLSSFPYRVSIPLGFFAVASASALLLAAVTVGFQAFKAATANPVRALRNE